MILYILVTFARRKSNIYDYDTTDNTFPDTFPLWHDGLCTSAEDTGACDA